MQNREDQPIHIQSHYGEKPVSNWQKGNQGKNNRDRRTMQMNQAWVGSPNSIENDQINLVSKITKQIQGRFP